MGAEEVPGKVKDALDYKKEADDIRGALIDLRNDPKKLQFFIGDKGEILPGVAAMFKSFKEVLRAFGAEISDEDQKLMDDIDLIVSDLSEKMNPEHDPLIHGISERARTASEKVKQRIEDYFLPHLLKYGQAAIWMDQERESIMNHVRYPEFRKPGQGDYTGWTDDEMDELYLILFNRDLRDII